MGILDERPKSAMAKSPFLLTRTLAPSQTTFEVSVDHSSFMHRCQSNHKLFEQRFDNGLAKHDTVLEKSEEIVFVVVKDQHKHTTSAVALCVNNVTKADHVRVGAVSQIGNLSFTS